jgi:ABC-type multidrug transport system fused ATPase/permease subunit
MEWSQYLLLRGGELHTSLLLAAGQMSHGAQLAVRGVAGALASAVLMVTALVVSWQLSLFCIAFGIAAVLSYRVGATRALRHARQLTTIASSLGNESNELFGNLKFFRSSGQVDRSERALNSVFANYAETYTRSQLVPPLVRAFFEGGASLVVVGILLVSLVTAGSASGVTAGTVAFLALFFRLGPRLMAAQDQLQNASTYSAWCISWDAQLRTIRAAKAISTGTAEPTFTREVRFERVDFGFAEHQPLVVKGLNLEIHAGEAIALVGESGSGKTTTLDMLAGLLRPTSGRILADMTDLRDVDVTAWQSRIGLVLQDTPLFHTTVTENICWGGQSRDEARVLACLSMAHAREFVERLPQGLNTTLGEGGARLSGGERQRIAIARALYRDPWLLLLDEPTSALDAESEDEVLRALNSVKGQCAIVLVAHRLRTVQLADRILVMRRGEVLESGAWDELVNLPNGAFADMAKRQDLGLELSQNRHEASGR